MPITFGDFTGFCNHCAAFDVPVQVPWSAPNIALCLNCFVAYCRSMDTASAAMRSVTR